MSDIETGLEPQPPCSNCGKDSCRCEECPRCGCVFQIGRFADMQRFLKAHPAFVHDRAEHMDVYLASEVDAYLSGDVT